MISAIARISVLPLVLAWLVLLTGPVQADNFLSHAYERIWLWEAYQIVCDAEGPGKQQSILGFKSQRGQEPKNNKGTGIDQRLTYSEFIARLDDKPLPPDIADLTPPGNGRSVDDAATELVNKKLTGDLNIVAIDSNLRGKNYNKPPGNGKGKKPGSNGGAKSLYDPNDPHRTPYTVLFDKLENTLSKYRLDSDNNAIVEKYIGRLKECSGKAVQLRVEATKNFVATKMGLPSDKGGFGADVRLTWSDSAVHGGDRYPEIDFRETFRNNREQLKGEGFKNRQDLANWATNFGDPAHASKVDFGPGAFSHFRTLQTWKNASHRINLTPEVLGTCNIK